MLRFPCHVLLSTCANHKSAKCPRNMKEAACKISIEAFHPVNALAVCLTLISAKHLPESTGFKSHSWILFYFINLIVVCFEWKVLYEFVKLNLKAILIDNLCFYKCQYCPYWLNNHCLASRPHHSLHLMSGWKVRPLYLVWFNLLYCHKLTS